MDGHEVFGVPVAVELQRPPDGALDRETGPFVDPDGAGVESEDGQGDSFDSDREGMLEKQCERLAAAATVLPVRGQQCPEVTAAGGWVPLVEDDLAHALAAGQVDHRQIEPVELSGAGQIPLT